MKIAERLRSLFGQTAIHVSISPEEIPSVDGLDARRLYATQANLQAVVSFLSDSVAQLPLKVYVRSGETDRERDMDSVAARLLRRPNADQTAYDFWNAVMVEYYLMGVSTIWLLPDLTSDSGYQLRLIPREWIMDTERSTNYAPDKLRITSSTGGQIVEIDRKDFVQFRRYSPGNPGGYQSPIAALRQTLNEQIQADRFRSEIWRSSGRFNAYITRPANVQPWDDGTRKRWAEAFRESWGKGGSNAGKMPLLEDGMEIKPYQFNAQQAQYAETKQLSREDVAAAYHVNPSLIWHSTTQTYASSKDNARALYAECLGPVLQMLQQRINSFLLPMLGADSRTYVEFDLKEKLKGSFEERASILQASVGGPWMTRNEARADNNLPPIDGGDELIVPLNVVEGGQASPQDTHSEPKQMKPMSKAAEGIRVKAKPTDGDGDDLSGVLKKFFKRQASSILPKIGARAEDWWDEDRWNAELAEDLGPIIEKIVDEHGAKAAELIGSEYIPEVTRAYLKKLAEGRAKAINSKTREKLEEVVEDPDQEPTETFKKREETDSDTLGKSLATAIVSWAICEAAHQAKRAGDQRRMLKQWVTGPNARPTHAAMNGQQVDIDSNFSNGARWPGDDVLPADETCRCNCSTEVVIM